jgi:exodeoxyribonuclease-3
LDIISLNVNGIRSSYAKGLFDWLDKIKPDIICLQEIRADLETITASLSPLKDYYAFFNPATKKGYSGVAIYTKYSPQNVVYGLNNEDIDIEGRYLQIDYNDLSIASIYLPSGTSGEHRQACKFHFMKHYTSLLEQIAREKRKFIICGDFNIAHQEIDLKNWKNNQNNSGFLPEERHWLTKVFEMGFVDSWRHLYPKLPGYTWWSNRGRAYANDVGWRIDYQIITPNLTPYLSSGEIFKCIKFSDHAPLIINYHGLREEIVL